MNSLTSLLQCGQANFDALPLINCLNPRSYKSLIHSNYRRRGSLKDVINYRKSFNESDFFMKCGSCNFCQESYKRSWATRLYLEADTHGFDNCCFVTLTYDDDHLPENSSVSLCDVQKFWKRLRKHLDTKCYGHKIRYAVVSEYGSDKYTHRPHYHAVIFGLSYIHSDLIRKVWQQGFVNLKPVTFDRCTYLSKYLLKSKFKKEERKKLSFLNKCHNFFTQSKGIGFAHVKKFAARYKKDSFIISIKRHLPSALMRKIFSTKEDFVNHYKSLAIKDLEKHERTRLKFSYSVREYLEYFNRNLIQMDKTINAKKRLQSV
ncbi:replication initiator protein [Jodiemicrovirus-1]|nr:replication initiator protein [Jodiemicrovirus-1]